MITMTRLSDIPDDRPIYLFGAGSGGCLVWKELRRNNKKATVAGFIDNGKKKESLDGLPIHTLDDLTAVQKHSSTFVISSQYVAAISAQLQAAGIDDYVDASPYIHATNARRLRIKEYIRIGITLIYGIPLGLFVIVISRAFFL